MSFGPRICVNVPVIDVSALHPVVVCSSRKRTQTGLNKKYKIMNYKVNLLKKRRMFNHMGVKSEEAHLIPETSRV